MKNFFKKNPFIIAELSGNHNGSLNKAKKIISAAKRIGVDAIKFQTIDPDKITFNSNNKIFKINDKKEIRCINASFCMLVMVLPLFNVLILIQK